MWGRGPAVTALVAVMSVAAAGCGAGARGVSDDDSYSIAVGEPDSLIPGDADQEAERRVTDALFTGLIRYVPDTAQPILAVAKSISSPDQRHWTIELEKGWTFHNGELVTSENFVRAWSATAYGPNEWSGARLLSRVKGFAEVNSEVRGESRAPKSETRRLSGLKIVDDYTFEVTLDEPFSQFPMMLGRPAFYPLPQVAFEDVEEFKKDPVGNGPYEMAEPWTGEEPISLTSYGDYAKEYENYGGELEAEVENLDFKIFSGKGAAYRGLAAGDVDIVPSLPPALMAGAEGDYGSRFVFRPGARLVFFGLPLYDKRFEDPRLRRALSLAIDREELTETFFAGTPTPAKSLISPAVPGGREEPCRKWCEYDPDKARKLLDKAGGYEGKLTLWLGSGADDAGWVRAVRGMLRANLGIDEVEIRTQRPSRHAALLTGREATGPWVSSIGPAYPSPHSYLRPRFTTDGRMNRTGYSKDRVDDLIRKGDRAGSIDEAIQRYQQAEETVLADMPVIPLWYIGANAAHSKNVSDVVVDAFGHVQVAQVQVS